jgi:hypothetical protein
MDGFPDLSVRVTTFDHRPVVDARVSAQSDAGAVATSTTDTTGRARLRRADAGELRVHVEAAGLEPQERSVSAERPERVELFVLGRPGMRSTTAGRSGCRSSRSTTRSVWCCAIPEPPEASPAWSTPARSPPAPNGSPRIPTSCCCGRRGTSPTAASRSSACRVTASTPTPTSCSGASEPATTSRMWARWCGCLTSTLRSSPTWSSPASPRGWTMRRWPNSRAATGSPRLAASATSATSTGCALAVGPPTRCWMPATPSPPRQRSSGQSQT